MVESVRVSKSAKMLNRVCFPQAASCAFRIKWHFKARHTESVRKAMQSLKSNGRGDKLLCILPDDVLLQYPLSHH